MQKHAKIQVGEYEVPLLFVPPSAVMEECDRCHDLFQFQKITLTKKLFLCPKCLYERIQRPLKTSRKISR